MRAILMGFLTTASCFLDLSSEVGNRSPYVSRDSLTKGFQARTSKLHTGTRKLVFCSLTHAPAAILQNKGPLSDSKQTHSKQNPSKRHPKP